MNHHEVDVLAAAGLLHIAACGLAGAGAVILGDGGVHAGLGHAHHRIEALQHAGGLGQIQVLHQAKQAGRDEQVALIGGHLALIHGIGGHAQGGEHVRAIAEIRRSRGGDAVGTGVGGQAEGVQLRHHAGADELGGQAREGQARGLLVVHGVHAEQASAVKVAEHGFVGQRHLAVHIAALAVIAGQAIHADLGDHQLVGVHALTGELRRTVQHGGQGRTGVHLVQQGNVALKGRNVVGHPNQPPSNSVPCDAFICRWADPWRRAAHRCGSCRCRWPRIRPCSPARGSG